MDRFPLVRDGWRWRTQDAVKVATGCVELGGGRFWVDATDPWTVVAFEAGSLEGMAQLSAIFGAHWTRTVASYGPSFVQRADDLVPPRLLDHWARLAVVTAVDQWSPEALDEALLLVDKALAWEACGNRGFAQETLMLVDRTVAALWDALTLHELPPEAETRVLRAVDLLREAEGLDEELFGLLTPDETAHHHVVVTSNEAGSGAAAVGRTARTENKRSADAVEALVPVVVNPCYLHPRVLAWSVGHYEVIARIEQDHIVVTAILSELCQDGSLEMSTLRGRVVDQQTGAILAEAPFMDTDVGGGEEEEEESDEEEEEEHDDVEDSAVTRSVLEVAGALDLVLSGRHLVVEVFSSDLLSQQTPMGLDRARSEGHLFTDWVAGRVARCSAASTGAPTESFVPVGESSASLDLRVTGRSMPPVDGSEVTAGLLAELLLDHEPEIPSTPLGASADGLGELVDSFLDQQLREWVLEIDLQGELVRTRATPAPPSAVDLEHADVTEESRCVGGQLMQAELSDLGLHPRVTWRFCQDPPSLTVLIAPTDDDAPSLPHLELFAGGDWVPFDLDAHGNLVAHAEVVAGAPTRVRVCDGAAPR